jgi:hypothetical protein
MTVGLWSIGVRCRRDLSVIKTPQCQCLLRGRRGAGDVRYHSFILFCEETSDGVRRARGLALDLLEAAKRMNTGSHTSVTTTTFVLGRSAGHALFQLAPNALEFVVPLIAFAVIATIMGVVLVRRRLG